MLDADIDTRARRIIKREQGEIKNRKKEIQNRERSESLRYKKYYDIDLKDTSIYDLVIDTTNKTPEEITDMILKEIND